MAYEKIEEHHVEVTTSTPPRVTITEGEVFFGFDPSRPLPTAEVPHGAPCDFCRGIILSHENLYNYCPVCHAVPRWLQAALDLMSFATNEPDAKILQSYADVIEEPFRLPPEELAPEPGVISVSDLRGDDRRSYRQVAGLGRRATP